MKTQFYSAIILAASFAFSHKSNAQANQQLSNLTSPTAVNVNLLPNQDNKRNLGLATRSWKDIYLDGKIFINDTPTLVVTTAFTTGNSFLGSNAGFSNTTGVNNSFFGLQAGYSNTSGGKNSFFGVNAGYYNVTGSNNSFFGGSAGNANTSGNSNVFVGASSGTSNTSGSFNVFAGQYAGYFNKAGYSNVAIGASSLFTNNNGTYSVAIGDSALYHSTGGDNIAIGSKSLYYATTGSENTATGYQSLYSNTTGYSNVAVGTNALHSNTAGHNLVAIGDSALFHQSVSSNNGYENTAVGSKALYANTTGYWNTATGRNALYANTTGTINTATGAGALISNITGSENTADGFESLSSNTQGSNNTAMGEEALGFNTTGYDNTATGWQALRSNTTGLYNTGDGYEAGHNVTDGSYNTFIGFSANCGSGGHLTNGMALGNQATVTSSNHIVIGNSSVTSIGGFANWSNLSDGRVKKNIRQNVPGLEFINKLQPITYNLDLNAADKIIALPERKDKDARLNEEVGQGKITQPSADELAARNQKEQIVYTGFVAQDVEKAAKELNYDFSGVDKPDNANTLYGLRYAEFVVPLVKAVQELSQENDQLKARIDKLEAMMSAQGKMSDELSVMSESSLQQNIPNPFNHTTTINYILPPQYTSAKITITDKNGSLLKQLSLSGNGKGSLQVDASTLASGAYQYSLYIDGKLISTKQMIITK